jgi:hypothetical protein
MRAGGLVGVSRRRRPDALASYRGRDGKAGQEDEQF